MVQIRDVMSKRFILVPPGTSIQDAAGLMRDHDFGFLPVAENGRLIGMVTDRDIAVRAVAEGTHPQVGTVRDVMTPKTYYCFEDQDVQEVCDNMSFIKVRRLPVVNQQKRVVGIVSMGDLAQACENGQVGNTLRQITNRQTASTEAA